MPNAVCIQSGAKISTPICHTPHLYVPQHPRDILISGIVPCEKPAQAVFAQVLLKRIVPVKALCLALKSWASAALRALKFDVDPPSSFSEAAGSVHRWIIRDVQIDHPARRVRALLYRFHCADQFAGYGWLLFGVEGSRF
jgi:hypothetical protein